MNKLAFRKIVLLSPFFFCTTLHANNTGNILDYKNRFIIGAAPIYGSLSDGGINRTNFALLANSEQATIAAYEPSINSNWGYQLYLGYTFGKDQTDDIMLNYINLHNSGDRIVSSSGDDSLLNNISAIQSASYLNGAASAHTAINFQTGEIIKHSYSQSDIYPIKYTYFYGLKIAGVTKKFNMNTAGLETGLLGEYYTNTIQYNNNLFGIGPKIGMGGNASLFKYISVAGDLSLALLGGSQNSQWNELQVLNGVNTPNNQTHNSAAWIPLVFGGNLSAGITLNAPKQAKFKIEGGVGGEVYLGAHQSDSFNISNAKFTNNLYFQDAFLKLTYFC